MKAEQSLGPSGRAESGLSHLASCLNAQEFFAAWDPILIRTQKSELDLTEDGRSLNLNLRLVCSSKIYHVLSIANSIPDRSNRNRNIHKDTVKDTSLYCSLLNPIISQLLCTFCLRASG